MSSSLANAVRLRSGQIGPVGLAAIAIGIMSPALGLFALWGPIQSFAGPIAPLVFLAGAILALPTAISYAALNAQAPSAGAASTWLWKAVSPRAGYFVGLTMTAYFLFATIAQPLLFAVFFRDLFAYLGLPSGGGWVLMLAIPVITLPVMWAAYRGAEASIRLAVALMVLESLVVVALSLTILFAEGGAPAGIDLAPFRPASATNGFGGFWTAMLLGVLAYSGFDVVSTAAEETNAPREHLPKTIILTILGITLFWALNAWAFTLAVSHEQVVAASEQGLTAVTPLAERLWGRGNLIVILTAITGIVAVYISAALGASRIVFALARHRLLPPFLARLDPVTSVPRNALHAVFGFVVVGGIVTLAVMPNGLAAFTWWANALVFFAMFTFAAVNAANFAYFRRVAPQGFRIGQNVIVPVIGLAMTLYVMWEMFFVALWNADFVTGRSVVMVCVALFAAFVVQVWGVSRWSAARLAGPAPLEAPGRSAQ